jgi:dCMP deaminase
MNWDEYFLKMAWLAARKSKDPSTHVGCIIVGPDKEILSTGFNGLPRGVRDVLERMDRPEKYLWTAHAEENAVAQAARVGARLKGATAYVTHEPCARCVRSLIQAGIVEVRVGNGMVVGADPKDAVAAATMLEEAGVTRYRLRVSP